MRYKAKCFVAQWSHAELKSLIYLRDFRRLTFDRIAQAIPGKTAEMCRYRYNNRHLLALRGTKPDIGLRICPVPVLLERERRFDAALSMDLTARMLGDPPPGYSALDRLNK